MDIGAMQGTPCIRKPSEQLKSHMCYEYEKEELGALSY